MTSIIVLSRSDWLMFTWLNLFHMIHGFYIFNRAVSLWVVSVSDTWKWIHRPLCASPYDHAGDAFSSLGNTQISSELNCYVTYRSISHEPECVNNHTSDPTVSHKRKPPLCETPLTLHSHLLSLRVSLHHTEHHVRTNSANFENVFFDRGKIMFFLHSFCPFFVSVYSGTLHEFLLSNVQRGDLLKGFKLPRNEQARCSYICIVLLAVSNIRLRGILTA